MNILFTGKGGKAGSWKMRGEQMAAAIPSARAIPQADQAAIDWADVIVVVKRAGGEWFDRVKRSGKPWVWDVIDFYPQPACTSWSRTEAIDWVLNSQLLKHMPDMAVFPTRAMMNDVLPTMAINNHLDKLHSIVNPHHHWLNPKPNPIRQDFRYIGYQGDTRYLGEWGDWVRKYCRRHGLEFVTNVDLHHMDAVIAFRDKAHNGYAQRNWKSAVKLNNAHATGTPIVCAKEAGYFEQSSGYEMFAEDKSDLYRMLDQLRFSHELRCMISREFKKYPWPVEKAAGFLCSSIEAYLSEKIRKH